MNPNPLLYLNSDPEGLTFDILESTPEDVNGVIQDFYDYIEEDLLVSCPSGRFVFRALLLKTCYSFQNPLRGVKNKKSGEWIEMRNVK